MNRRQRDEAQAFDEAWEARARTHRAPFDDEVAHLVACAEQLCEAAVIEPSAEFRYALRTQLMTEAATVLALISNEMLFDAVNSLPPEQRDCILMRFIQGLSIAETAAALKRSEGAIKQLQLRAVRSLAKRVPGDLR